MLKKGDRVMIERLGYVGLEQTILSSGGEIRCFSDNLNKLKLSEIEQELRKSKPKLVYLIPDFSNPCGDNLREDVRKLMVKLATKLSFWVIEDQTYREIYFDKNEHLASMFSRSDKVIIVGSISKIIVPGLRIGWLVTKDDLLRQKITQLKESFTLSTNNLSQKLIARLLETEYEKMIRWVRNYYGKKMKKTLENLEKNIPERFSFSKPRGGFYIWIEGPEGFQAKKTLNLALGNGIGFMPGGVFYYNNKKANTFRLSISAIKEKDIKDGIDRLTKTLEGKKLLIKKNIGWKGKIKEFILNLHHRLQLMFVR